MSQNYTLNLEFLGTGVEQLNANIKSINASLVSLKTTAESVSATLGKAFTGATMGSTGSGILSIAAGYDVAATKAGTLNKIIAQQSGFLNSVYTNGNKVMQSRYFGSGITGLAQAHQRLNAELQNTLKVTGNQVSFWNQNANAVDAFKLRADMLSRTLDTTLQKWTAMGKNMQWTGRQGMVGVTAPILAIGGISIDEAIKQAESIQRLQQLTGTLVSSGGSVDFSKQTKQVQDYLTLDTKLSQTMAMQKSDLISITAEFSGLGGTMAEHTKDLTTWTAQFNLISGLKDPQGAKTFIEQLANANVALGKGVQQTGNDLAYLNYLEQNSQINMQQIVSSFPSMVQMMETFHMNLGEVMGVLTTFKSEGLSIDNGATKFTTSMGRVIAAVTAASAGLSAGRLGQVRKELEKFEKDYNVHLNFIGPDGKLGSITDILTSLAQVLKGVQTGDPNSINLSTALFGTRSYASMDPVLQGVLSSYMSGPNKQGQYSGYAGAIQTYQNSNQGANLQTYLGQNVSALQNNPAVQWQNLINQLKNLAIAIGNDLLPVFMGFVKDIEKVIGWFDKLSPGTRQLIEKIALLAAAIPPIVYMFGQFNILGSLIAKGLTKPFTTFFKLQSRPLEDVTAPGIRTELAHLTAMQRAGATPESVEAKRQEIEHRINSSKLTSAEKTNLTQNAQMATVAEKQSMAANKQLEAAEMQMSAAKGETQGKLFDQSYYKKNLAAQNHEEFASQYDNKIKNARRDFERMTPGASYPEAEFQSYISDLRTQRDKHLESASRLRTEDPVQGTLFGHNPKSFELTKNPTLAIDESIKKSGGTLKKLLTADTSVWFGQGLTKGMSGAKGALQKITESSVGKKVGGSAIGKFMSPMKMLFPAVGEEGGATLLTSFAPLIPVLALIGGAIYLIVKNWHSFVSEVSGPLKALKAAFMDLIHAVLNPFKAVFKEVGLTAGKGSSQAHAMGTAIASAFKIAKGVIQVTIDLISPWVHVLADVFGAVISAIQVILDLITGKWSAAWQAARNLVGFAVQGMLQMLARVPEQLMGLVSTLSGWLSHIPGVGKFFGAVSRDVKNWKNDMQQGIDDVGKMIRGSNDASNILDPNKAKDSGKKAGKAAKEGVQDGLNSAPPPALPDIAGAPSSSDASAFASAFEAQMGKIVAQWKQNVLNAYDEMIKKRDKAFDAQTKQLDETQKKQDKVFDNEKKQLTEVQKLQDEQNKAKEAQNNIAADIAEGKYSDAKGEQLKSIADMNSTANQDAQDAIDQQKQNYDDQIQAQKDALTQQKQLFDDQASAQKQSLQDQLDNITTYTPMTEAAMNNMQGQMLSVINQAAGKMNLGAYNQGVQFNSGWQDAINNTENDLIKQAQKSGTAVASEFASAIAATNAAIAGITGGSVGDPGNANPATPSTPDTSGAGSSATSGGNPGSSSNPTVSGGGHTFGFGGSSSPVDASGGRQFIYQPGPGITKPKLHSGGDVGGLGDVPAILQSGEFVIQRPAAQALGLQLLKKLNFAHKFHDGGLAGYLSPAWTNIMNQVITGWIGGHPSNIGGANAKSIANSMRASMGSSMGGQMGGGSQGAIPRAPVNISSIVALGQQLASSFGWGTGNEWNALYDVFNRESGWNPYAVNKSSGAYGIPQSLGHGHPFDLGDARSQILWGLNYIKGRYHDPINAWQHELSAGWYHGGGSVLPQLSKGGFVVKDGAAFLHKGETVATRPLTNDLNKAVKNMANGGNSISIDINLNGPHFGTDAELRKMGEYFENTVIPKIQKAAGHSRRVVTSYAD